jgi:hypothetical protein
MDSHVFHIVDPNLKSYRLLYDFEHERLLRSLSDTNTKLYCISKENWMCNSLGAKANDIVCIKNHLGNIYRRVI